MDLRQRKAFGSGMYDGQSILQKIISTRPNNILAYWPLDDASGTVAAVNRCAAGQCLLNPTFETAGAGGADIWLYWTETAGDGTIADETTLVHGGTHAVKLTTGASKNARITQNFTTVPGKTYTLNVWCAGDGTHQGRIQIKDNISTLNLSLESSGVTASVYGLYSKQFTAPANCTQVGITLYNSIATAGDVVYYDDCTVNITAAEKGYDAIVSGATVGQILSGIKCFSFDGTNDFVNLLTPSLQNGFNGAEGSMVCFGHVSALAEWTDTADRYLMRFKTSDGADAATFGKSQTDNTVFWQFNAAGTDHTFTKAITPHTNWFSLGLTWSVSGGVVQPYYNGLPGDDPETPGAPWDGIFNTRALLGGEDTGTPADSWKGYGAHAVLWNAALTAAEMNKFRP